MDQPERVRYFDQQFLRVDDFNAEQDYHRDMRRRHNRMLHTPGIADGLQLVADGTGVKITPGAAIAAGADGNGGGAEIVLADGRRQELSSFPVNADVYVTIRFEQEKARERSDTGVKDFTRWREYPVIEAFPSDPTATPPSDPNEPLRVLLGKVTRGGSGGKDVLGIDISGRRLAGSAESELSLTPRNPAFPESDWVRLRWTGRGAAEMRGSFSIVPGGPAPGDLSVAGNLSAGAGLSLGGGARARTLRIDTTASDPRVSQLMPGSLQFHFPGAPGGFDAALANDAPARLSLMASTVYVSGTLGVGTSAPAQSLHITGNALLGNTFVGDVGHGSNWAGLSHRDAVGPLSYALLHQFDGRNTFLNKRSGGGTIEFRVDNVTKLNMDDAGNLGIAGSVFNMAIGKNALRAHDDWLRLNQDGNFKNGVHSPGLISANTMNVGGVGGWSGPSTAGYLLISSRVGIGTDTPAHSLHSTGNGLFNNAFIGDVGHGAGWAGISHRDAVGPSSYGLLMLSDGRATFLNKRSGGGTIEFRVDNGTKLAMDDGGTIFLNGKDAFESWDPWLRLNQQRHFSEGVYTPGKFRADGGIEVFGGGLYVDGDTRLGAADRVVYIGGNQTGPFIQFHDDLWFSDPQDGTIWLRNHNNSNWGTLAGFFVNKSSIHFKQDVESVAGDDLDRLYDDARATRVVRFRYNGETEADRLHVGVIAEESPAYILGVDGDSVSLMEYTAMLHGAVQVLAAKVEELEGR